MPRLAFQPLASSVRNVSTAAAISAGVRATSKCDRAMFGEAIALAAQFFQFLRAQRLAQQFVGVAGSVEAGAHMRLQHQRLHAVAAQHLGEGLHGRAIERDGAQDQRMRAGLPGLLHDAALTASSAMSRSSSGVHSVP